MRIIAGKYKRTELKSVPGNTARPTMDFLKETIFNILPDCSGIDFLDLYAGTGSIALEALSRGARRVVMVEFAQQSIAIIISNIEKLGCQTQCQVVRKKVIPFIRKSEDKFDIIFLDPPYEKGLVNETVTELIKADLLNNEGYIVIEHSIREKPDPAWESLIVQSKKTSQSQITIIKLS